MATGWRLDSARVFWIALVAILAAAMALRWGRLPIAWSAWTFDYLAYIHPHWLDLQEGRLPWTVAVGNHPPQYAFPLLAALQIGGVRAALWVTVLASVGAVAIGAIGLRRAVGTAPGLVFAVMAAVSPLQCHYALDQNNYPFYLFAFALTAVTAHTAWTRGTAGAVVALGLACALAVHTHYFTLPLLAALAVAAAARKRGWLVLAVVLGTASAAPVLPNVADMFGDDRTYINTPALQTSVHVELYHAWIGRFGTSWAFAAALIATAVAGRVATRAPLTRTPAVFAAAALAVSVAVLLVAFLVGGAAIHQTPYWVVPSWCAFVLLALGVATADGRLRVFLFLLLLVWLVPALARDLRPRSFGPGELGWSEAAGAARVPPLGSSPHPAELTRYLDDRFAARDVLVYLRFFDFDNDEPHRWDPLFTAIRPGHVGTWLPADNPCGRMGFHYREGALCMGNELHPGEGIHPRMIAALGEWIASGRTVHLVLADADSASSPPYLGLLEDLDATLEKEGVGRNLVVVISPSLRSLGPLPHEPRDRLDVHGRHVEVDGQARLARRALGGTHDAADGADRLGLVVLGDLEGEVDAGAGLDPLAAGDEERAGRREAGEQALAVGGGGGAPADR